MDRLKQLETFAAVVARGSLSAAAQAEGVTPAVTDDASMHSKRGSA